MPRNLIRKLLGKSDPPPEVVRALDELDRLCREKASIAGPASILREVLPVIYSEPMRVEIPELNRGRTLAKLAEGHWQLRGETLTLDRGALARRWQQICQVLQRHQPGDAAELLARAVSKGQLDPAALLDQVLAGDGRGVHAAAEAQSCDADLAATVLRLAVFPVLCQLQNSLGPLRVGCRWEHGYCPTCGSGPLLGELRGLEQLLFLRCGWCAAEWEFPRLQCPWCGSPDHRLLGFLSAEGEEDRRRAATCDQCHGYVKMMATLSAWSPVELLVADVATLHLDLAAAARGYAGSQA